MPFVAGTNFDYPGRGPSSLTAATDCATHLLPSSRFRQASILPKANPSTKPLEQISFADIRDHRERRRNLLASLNLREATQTTSLDRCGGCNA